MGTMSGDASYKLIDEPSAKMNIPAEVGILLLRIVVCLTVVHHGLQKWENPDGFAQNMVDKWFPFLPMPIFWTYLAILMEVIAPIFLAIGVFARLAAFGMFATMIFANVFHFKLTGFEGFPLGVPTAGAYAFEPSLL